MTQFFNFKNAALAGIIAGAVFFAVELLLVATVGGESPWGPPRMIAAIAMGEEVLPPPATFDLTILLVAALVHFALAIVLGVIFALLFGRWTTSLGAALAIGTIFGLVLYAINFYVMTAVFPWFGMARNMISIVAHAIFGLALGWAYHALNSRVRAIESRIG